jgi:hypothetical protein
MAARSLLFREGQELDSPAQCGPGRQEVVVTFVKEGRLYRAILRDKQVIEDPYLHLVKAAAFAIQQNEPYMGRVIPRSARDLFIRSSVVV